MIKNKLLISLEIIIILIFTVSSVLAYNQAPALDEKVEEGELPSVEERLPDNPQVIEPVEEIGDYGGTWNYYVENQSQTQTMMDFTHVGLLRWDKNQQEPKPALAEDWEVNEEGTEFTFHLREGLKWSDGEPFNADDIMFWYEAILNNSDITAAPESFFVSDGELMDAEKIDDHTVKFSFENPQGLFIEQVVKHNGYHFYAPEHYLKQFHIDYADEEEIEEMLEEEGYEEWYELFDAKNDPWELSNPDRPYMLPWIPTTDRPSERFVFERNPYFYKVDTEDNQLPYLDKVVLSVVDSEVMIMRTVAGDSDFQPSEVINFQEYPLLRQNAEKEDYEVLLWDHLTISEPALHLNFNVKDEVLNELFQNKDFRIALSHAMDRKRMSVMLYNDVAKPAQPSLSPVSRYFKDEYRKAYTDYDLEKSEQILDNIDLISEKDNDGIRVTPDGDPITIEAMLPTGWPHMVDVLELVKEDWEEVGIELNINEVDPGLYWTNKPAGDYEIDAWPFAKSATDTNLVPETVNSWGPDYARWYIAGKEVTGEAEEPPAEIKELFDIWDEIKRTVDQEEKDELYDELLQRQAENLWIIGTVGMVPKLMPKRNHFHNVPEESTWSWHHGHFIGQTEPSQYFIEKEAQ